MTSTPESIERLEREFREFAVALPRIGAGGDWSGAFFALDSTPSNDFNREIIRPGGDIVRDGAVAIMADMDYWTVARVPYRFRDLSARQLVTILWPSVGNAVFRPDHGDPWWECIDDQTREAPGTPYELWFGGFSDADGVVIEPYRLEVYAGDVEALEALDRCTEEYGPGYEVRVWRNGVRRTL